MRSPIAHLALLLLQVCTSREKLFGMITFIDTPGLVDGSFHYPFPVEDAILAVAKHTDLIYVFFDPIGQAPHLLLLLLLTTYYLLLTAYYFLLTPY